MKQEETAIIKNPCGLHARPSVKIVDVANGFSSNIFLECNGVQANAKVILDIMSLGANCGTEIQITAEGEDANQAIAAIKQALEEIYSYD
jgi:phosphocarrier protein HPr